MNKWLTRLCQTTRICSPAQTLREAEKTLLEIWRPEDIPTNHDKEATPHEENGNEGGVP